MARWDNIEGNAVDLDTVVGVSKLKSIPTGSLSCDWTYGFDILFPSSALTVALQRPRSYGYAGGVSRETFTANAQRVRDDFAARVTQVS